MQLIFNPSNRTISIDGEQAKIDTYYPVDDDHRLIIRIGGMIQLKKGKKTLESVALPRISAVAGRSPSGDPTPQYFMTDIVPGKPIFPQTRLAKVMMDRGIEGWHIHFMNEGQVLHEIVAAHSSPFMACGDVAALSQWDVPGHGDFMDSVEFSVRPEAGWAVLGFSKRPPHLSSIYLWPGAVNDEDNLLPKVEELNSL